MFLYSGLGPDGLDNLDITGKYVLAEGVHGIADIPSDE